MKPSPRCLHRWPAALGVLLLCACSTQAPPPPPPTAHFDEASQSLTVDCVRRVGDGFELPANFRFSARRQVESGVEPGADSVSYAGGPLEALPADSTPVACPNRAYAIPQSGSNASGLYMILPEVLSSNGERFRLELFKPDTGTGAFAELGKHTRDNQWRDIMVTAGATVSIPLADSYSESSSFYLQHRSGRHSPELAISGTPATLHITGVGPGTFELVATSEQGVKQSHEERMLITVCSAGDDLDECNSDPEDCDCLATDQRLNAEIAIRTALFRYQMTQGSETGITEANRYCLQIETGRYYSDDQGNTTSPPGFNWHRIYMDPPEELLQGLAGSGHVTMASHCARELPSGVFDLDSGERAVILISGAITWQSDTRVVMEGGYYASSLDAAGQVITLDRIDGQWQVVHTRGVWRS